MLRYGILSTSSIAPRFIAAVRQANAGKVLAISSRSLAKAQEKAALWQIPTAYGSHNDLLNDPQIDIVYISCLNAAHYPWAKAALEHGKHVICEKPCTTSAAHTRELFDLAREKKLFLMEAQKMLFLPAVIRLREHILSGDLGDITMVQLSHSFPASYNNWMYDKDSGGPLYSSGIYAVQLLQWLFGPLSPIYGTGSFLKTDVPWQYVLSGSTESGILFTAKNSTRGILDNTARFFGTKGWAELPEYWKARKLILHLENGETVLEEFPCIHELSYEAQHIADCFSQGLLTSPVITPNLSIGGISTLENIQWQ